MRRDVMTYDGMSRMKTRKDYYVGQGGDDWCLSMILRSTGLIFILTLSGCTLLDPYECRNAIFVESTEYCEVSFTEVLTHPRLNENIVVIGYVNALELPDMLGLREVSIEGPVISSELIVLVGSGLQHDQMPGYYRVFGQLRESDDRFAVLVTDMWEYWKPVY